MTALTEQRIQAVPAEDLLRVLAAPDDAELAQLDAWWRANNYLTVGQIYLLSLIHI